MVMATQGQFHHIHQEKGDADTDPSTDTVDAQAPVFTRVQQAKIGLQWLMFYKHDIYSFEKSTIGARSPRLP